MEVTSTHSGHCGCVHNSITMEPVCITYTDYKHTLNSLLYVTDFTFRTIRNSLMCIF